MDIKKLINDIHEEYKSVPSTLSGNIDNKHIKIIKKIICSNLSELSQYFLGKDMDSELFFKRDKIDTYMKKMDDITNQLRFFRYIIYWLVDIITRKTIKSEKYMKSVKKHIYHIIACDTKDKEMIFCLFLWIYWWETFFLKKGERIYLGIDYEFNTKKVTGGAREIALAQFCFETEIIDENKNYNNYIFLVYPPNLRKATYDLLVNKILLNKRIIKVLHGSDSLDIPYMYDELLKNDVKKIETFTYGVVDTRYLCEYNNLINNDLEAKCKIYYLLNQLGIISSKQFEWLLQNEKDMGHIWNIKISVDTLSDELLNYTAFDVVYLKQLYLHFDTEKVKSVIDVINEITRLIFIEKKGITTIMEKIKNKTNWMNNFTFTYKKEKITFSDFFNNFINETKFETIDISKLILLNNFRTIIMTILKFFVYQYIVNNTPVTIKENQQFIGYLGSKYLYNELMSHNYHYVLKMIAEIRDKLKIEVPKNR